jgi:hypothetical protein
MQLSSVNLSNAIDKWFRKSELDDSARNATPATSLV